MRGSTPPPPYVFMAWCLIKHSGNLAFYLCKDKLYMAVQICISNKWISRQNCTERISKTQDGRSTAHPSMEQSSWEASNYSGSQKIPRLLWKQKVHYHAHNSPPIIPILTQMNPVRHFPPYFPETKSNIILPSPRRSSGWFVPFRFPDRNFKRMQKQWKYLIIPEAHVKL